MNATNYPLNMRVTLKTARELAGLTQMEAAKTIGVSPDTLGNYERGRSYPDIPTLRKIESVYGVGYDRLIFCLSISVEPNFGRGTMKLNSADLRRQCVVHRRREPCFICEGHETITEAHHVMSLKDVAFILEGGGLTMEEPPIVWLCPNCHMYLHGFYREKLSENAFSEKEFRRMFCIDNLGWQYLNRQSERW